MKQQGFNKNVCFSNHASLCPSLPQSHSQRFTSANRAAICTSIQAAVLFDLMFTLVTIFTQQAMQTRIASLNDNI